MSSDDKFLGLLEQIADHQRQTTECVNRLDKKLDLNIQKVEYELKAINALDTKQNEILEEHMRRTELAEYRLEILEEPRKVVKLVVKLVIGLGSIAGATIALSKFFGWF